MPVIRDISPYQRLGLLALDSFAKERALTSRREIETAGTRHLLNDLLRDDQFELRYDEHKKPFLPGRNERISISHSHDWLAIMVNGREETGIDIELIRGKVLRIRHKFLNETERRFAGEDLECLISLWAAKEAMYKAYGRKQVDFSAHMSVQPFSGPHMRGTLLAGGVVHQYAMRRERIGDYILVYVLNEIPVAHPEAR